MSFLTNLAKDFGKSVINQAQRMNEWKQEADMLNDEELVRRLNNYLPGQKKNAYSAFGLKNAVLLVVVMANSMFDI